jgi:hypothetical protein
LSACRRIVNTPRPLPANLIVISEHVDYWNRLGWVDQNSSKVFSNRQSAYAERLHSDSVYTPQLLIDGTFPLVGSQQGQAEKSIGSALKTPKSMSSIQANGKALHVHLDPTADKRTAAVYLVLAADHLSSQVTAGENSGRLLAHTAVAYSIRKIGNVGNAPFEGEFRPNVKPQSRVIVFAQDEKTGHVVAAAQTKVE